MVEQAKEQIVELVELNKKKLALLDRILELTRSQKLSITSNSLNALLDAIRQKQEVMDQIDTIDRSFYTGFMELKLILGIKDIDQIDVSVYPEVLALKNYVGMIMRTLEEIESLDQENMEGVQSEIEKVKGSMREVQSHRKLSKGYANAASTYGMDAQGFYIDGKK